jgi:general secretion pathway protein N
MRIRLPLGRSLFFLLFFLFSLVALAPLALALRWLGLDQSGFAAREAEGSVWLGALKEAQLGPVALGDVQARLRMLPLLIGRARTDLERGGEGDALHGGITVSRHAVGIDDFSADLPLGSAFAPLPLASLDLGDVSVHFADGACAGAEGLVKAGLAGDAGGIALPRRLSGRARCDGGALLLPLVSQSGMERLDVRLFEDGRYRVELALRPGDDATRQRLAASGFVPAGAAFVLRANGEF